PTIGTVKIRGRVASLLEVGTGFHPELTGRENIYLNGSILGLKKIEINRQLDAIIDFSGVERFIDTPLKHYSSGMEMRLAFSVAAHLEPEVLLIDEVLAVGDLEFQNKCIGKMNEISKSQGRTILFVSHNLRAINELCNKVLFLDNGKSIALGSPEVITEQYIRSLNAGSSLREIKNHSGSPIAITQLRSLDGSLNNKNLFSHKEEIGIGITIQNLSWTQNFSIGFGLHKLSRERILRSEYHSSVLPENSRSEFIVWLPATILVPGHFTFNVSLIDNHRQVIDLVTDGLNFSISNVNSEFEGSQVDHGMISCQLKWDTLGEI
ncbi:MAG TPA: ABC transporter ATP-binding protein, partial [Chitinophagaceae bacterium]|nr:ABC transporter ATP-binding protein [Chitinophagaceae bacterium]